LLLGHAFAPVSPLRSTVSPDPALATAKRSVPVFVPKSPLTRSPSQLLTVHVLAAGAARAKIEATHAGSGLSRSQ
jgi:hypothetical protein